METFNMKVNLSVREAMDIIKEEIQKSFSGECIDSYRIEEEEGSCWVAVFENTSIEQVIGLHLRWS